MGNKNEKEISITNLNETKESSPKTLGLDSLGHEPQSGNHDQEKCLGIDSFQ